MVVRLDRATLNIKADVEVGRRFGDLTKIKGV
jgi:hypothetical protein